MEGSEIREKKMYTYNTFITNYYIYINKSRLKPLF